MIATRSLAQVDHRQQTWLWSSKTIGMSSGETPVEARVCNQSRANLSKQFPTQKSKRFEQSFHWEQLQNSELPFSSLEGLAAV